jgi:hypothetical protein
VYITNPEVIDKNKIYFCNGIIGEFLIYQKNLPLFCKKGRLFGFSKTDALEKALKELPFWLKCTKVF